MDISDIFAPRAPVQKRSKQFDTAQFLRILASLLDRDEEEDNNVPVDEQKEVLTRPHFMPSGGP